jgi:hypothetical protein
MNPLPFQVIKKRNKILLEELANESRQSAMDPFFNKSKKRELDHIEKELSTFTMKVEREKICINKILEKTQILEKKLTCFQLCMDGSLASRNNKSLVSSRIKALESELDRKFIKFNDVVTENSCLRQEIDHLRLERASFDRIYSKMEREFKTKVESISVLQSSIAELEGKYVPIDCRCKVILKLSF